jgi:hypothetical protein
MKLKTYLSLFQTRHLLLYAWLGLMAGSVILAIALKGNSASNLATGRAFAVFTIILGATSIGEVFSAPFRSSGIALLPNAPRSILRWHFVVTALLSFVCGLALQFLKPALPWPVGALLIAAVFSTFLFHNPAHWSWKSINLQLLFLSIAIAAPMLASAGGVFAQHLWTVGGASLLVVAVAFYQASRRQHLRNCAVPTKGELRPGTEVHRPHGGIRSWSLRQRLVRKMQATFPTGPLGLQLLGGLVAVVFACLLMALLRGGETWKSALVELVFNSTERGSLSTGFLVFVVLGGHRIALLRRSARAPYVPLPRRQMALLSLLTTFSYCAVTLALVTVVTLGLGIWGARVSGQDVSGTMIIKVVIGNALWLSAAPMLNPRFVPSYSMFTFAYVCAGATARLVLSLLFQWGLPAGALVCAGLVVASHLLFYFDFRRRFQTQDLVANDADESLREWLGVPTSR